MKEAVIEKETLTVKKTIRIEDREMAYLDVGQGDVLLLGHSYMWDSAMWAPQVAFLSQHFRCIVPDFWAHGDSDVPPESMTVLNDYVDHVMQLMDALTIKTFSVVGLSIGGMWGAKLASKHAGRVNKLVMMGTYLGDEPEDTHQLYFSLLDRIDQDHKIIDEVAQVLAPIFFSEDAAQTIPKVVNDFIARLEAIPPPMIPSLTRIGRMIFSRKDHRDDLNHLQLPVLIMVGDEDKPRPVSESREMLERLSNGQLAVIPKAGHISTLEQPDFINEKLQSFLL